MALEALRGDKEIRGIAACHKNIRHKNIHCIFSVLIAEVAVVFRLDMPMGKVFL